MWWLQKNWFTVESALWQKYTFTTKVSAPNWHRTQSVGFVRRRKDERKQSSSCLSNIYVVQPPLVFLIYGNSDQASKKPLNKHDSYEIQPTFRCHLYTLKFIVWQPDRAMIHCWLRSWLSDPKFKPLPHLIKAAKIPNVQTRKWHCDEWGSDKTQMLCLPPRRLLLPLKRRHYAVVFKKYQTLLHIFWSNYFLHLHLYFFFIQLIFNACLQLTVSGSHFTLCTWDANCACV